MKTATVLVEDLVVLVPLDLTEAERTYCRNFGGETHAVIKLRDAVQALIDNSNLVWVAPTKTSGRFKLKEQE